MRTAIIVAGDLFALLLYSVGLISPLTPSEGIPRLWELLVFAAGPLALLAACAHASHTVIRRIVVAVQILGVGSFTGVLLWMHFRTMV